MRVSISASTLVPKDINMLDYVKSLNDLDIDYVHCDIMDGKFVEPITYDIKTLKTIKKIAKHKLDTHLMIVDINKAMRYARVSDIVTIHYEAIKDLDKAKKLFVKMNKFCRTGIAINPDTEVDAIVPLLPYVGYVLVMGVFPGYSGQKHISGTANKVKQIKAKIEAMDLEDILVSVDGGVDTTNANKLIKSGADVLCVASVLYKAADKSATISMLRP